MRTGLGHPPEPRSCPWIPQATSTTGVRQLDERSGLGTQLAVLRLKARGFGVTVFGRKSETVPPGSVIDTLPDAGSRNRRGTFVMVEFSAGRNPLPVPNVVGLDTQVAFPQLVGLGLIVLELREPNPLPAGRVIDTDPPAN